MLFWIVFANETALNKVFFLTLSSTIFSFHCTHTLLASGIGGNNASYFNAFAL